MVWYLKYDHIAFPVCSVEISNANIFQIEFNAYNKQYTTTSKYLAWSLDEKLLVVDGLYSASFLLRYLLVVS